MSQNDVEALKVTVSRTFEWLSRALQLLLVALIFWFGSEVVELRTLVAVLTERFERQTTLENRVDRVQNHIDSIDTRVRALERSQPLPPHL